MVHCLEAARPVSHSQRIRPSSAATELDQISAKSNKTAAELWLLKMFNLAAIRHRQFDSKSATSSGDP